jgi:hypothetical protein
VRFANPDTVAHPLKAVGMSLVPNAVIYGIDRFVTRSDFAYVTMRSIDHNFTHAPLWDDDLFDTNLMGHPFHGSMDFSGARVSGMNYWQSFGYAFGASLLWETIGENETPAINDQINTSIGGALLGEFSLRVSSLIIDNNARGFNRALRETLGMLTCPMNGINRLLTGQMWSHRPTHYTTEPFPIWVDASLRTRQLYALNRSLTNRWAPYLDLRLVYGDLFSADNLAPLDYFRVRGAMELNDRSAFLSKIDVRGLLWGRSTDIGASKGWESMWGVFQSYSFNRHGSVPGDSVPAIRFSAPAQVGLGLALRKADKASGSNFSLEGHADAVILGAANATRFRLESRDYNFGQGYSTWIFANWRLRDRFELIADAQLTQLFTWRGYREGIDPSRQNERTFNCMGDRGNTLIFSADVDLRYRVVDRLALVCGADIFLQANHNRHLDDSSFRFADWSMGVEYCF